MTQLAALLASASLGAMLFFSAAIGQTIFQALPEKEAGKLFRAVFPKYFLVNGIVAAGPVYSPPSRFQAHCSSCLRQQ